MHFCSVHRLFDALAHDITQTGYGLEAALRGTRQAGGAEVPGGGWFCTHPMNLAVNSLSLYDIPAFVRINTLSHHVMHTYYDLVRYQKLLHHCSKEEC